MGEVQGNVMRSKRLAHAARHLVRAPEARLGRGRIAGAQLERPVKPVELALEKRRAALPSDGGGPGERLARCFGPTKPALHHGPPAQDSYRHRPVLNSIEHVVAATDAVGEPDRPVGAVLGDVQEIHCLLPVRTGSRGVGDGTLERPLGLAGLSVQVGRVREEAPAPGEPELVAFLLEHGGGGERLLTDPPHVGGASCLLDELADARVSDEASIAQLFGNLDGLREHIGSTGVLALVRKGCGEIDLQLDAPRIERAEQGGRPPEQVDRGRHIGTLGRSMPGAREPLGCAPADLDAGVVERSELRAIAICLLEVVAEDLVQLHERRALLLQPLGEAFVQLGPSRLRQRVVCGVADQQMTEAIGVVAR